MTTVRQHQANRRNALRSTGPKTLTGKAASSRNAISHGLTARQVVLECEDPADYNERKAQYFEEMAPEGRMEKDLVERLADLSWRLRRVPRLEAALIEAVKADPMVRMKNGVATRQGSLPRGSLANTKQQERSEQILLGVTVRELLVRDNLLGKLSRHQSQLIRDFDKTLATLRREQRDRLAKEAAEEHAATKTRLIDVDEVKDISREDTRVKLLTRS